MRTDTISETIRSFSPLDRTDYVDVCTVATDGKKGSPEEWARAVVEGAAGLAGQFVWRVVMGLRLEPRRSPAYIGGWRIADRGENWLRLEAASWFLTAHIVCHVDDQHVSAGVFVRYDRPVAALIFPPVGFGHRRAIASLIRRGARRIR